MSTDFQAARKALGRRLSELRGKVPTQRALADVLGWPQSKVSKLETGQQTATPDDLKAWAAATGHPEAEQELLARLKGLESQNRSWRRQLRAGHRPVQDALTVEYERSTVLHAWQNAMVVGMLQTSEYAREVFSGLAELYGSPRDIDDAVRARKRRQELLYEPGRTFHVLMGENALHVGIAPPAVLAAQLDRLMNVIGTPSIHLGIVPFGARVTIPPANGFWKYDERLVIVEDWDTERWLDDAHNVALHGRVWHTLNEAAVYGTHARRLIARARAQFADLA